MSKIHVLGSGLLAGGCDLFLQEWHFPQQLFFGSSLQLGEVPRASGMSSEDEAGSESSGPPSSHESSSGESVEDSNSSDAENESADQDGDASAGGSDESAASAGGSDESADGSRSDSGGESSEAPSARPDLKIVSRPESLAEHMRRHPNNSASKFCGRCQFYRNRQEIESSCLCKHPMTGAKFTWIGEQPDPSREWGVGCHICAAAGEKNQLSKYAARSRWMLRPQTLARHSDSHSHRRALEAWFARTSGSHSSVATDGQTSAVDGQTSTVDGQTSTVDGQTSMPASAMTDGQTSVSASVSHAEVLAALTAVHEKDSFRSYERRLSTTSMSGAGGSGGGGRSLGEELWNIMADAEKLVTYHLLMAASMIALIQDARGGSLLVMARVVLWKWPRQLRGQRPSGVECLGQGHEGPWTAERILNLKEMGAQYDGPAQAKLTVKSFKEACVTEDSFNQCKSKVTFFATDNASDEAAVYDNLHLEFENCRFEVKDSSHTLQLAIKNGVKGEPEVEKVQHILLTGKKPHKSLSSLLRHSPRFRKVFSDRQQEDALSILEHLGWAPQRLSSRSRPWGRISMRLKSLLAALSDEVDHGAESDTAAIILREISPYRRLLIAGLMADLTHEHYKAVRETDERSVCPTSVMTIVTNFKQRVKVLFLEGMIMTVDDSFTGQVLKFLKAPQLLLAGRHAHLFSMPVKADREAYFEPLERVRAVVGNVLVCLDAAFPPESWQYAFAGYRLPSPLLKREVSQQGKAMVKTWLMRIFQQGSLEDSEKVYEELTTMLLPAADQLRMAGNTVRESWAIASSRFPELTQARVAVSLLLACAHSTSNVERYLKVVASQLECERRRMSGVTLAECVIADAHAPAARDVHSSEQGRLYLNRIVKMHGLRFGRKRRAKTQRRPRRDKGRARNPQLLETNRRRQGKPATEKSFLKQRALAIQRATRLPPEKRKEACSAQSIPEDSGKFVTAAIEKVRAKAKERGKRKGAALSRSSVKRRRADGQTSADGGRARWIGGDSSVTSPRAVVGNDSSFFLVLEKKDLLDEDDADVFMRRQWLTYQSLFSFLRSLRQRQHQPGASVFVVGTLNSEALQNHPLAGACQVFGGFLTCRAWVQKALVDNATPRGLAYDGLLNQSLVLGCSSDVQEAERTKLVMAGLQVASGTAHCKLQFVKLSRLKKCIRNMSRNGELSQDLG